MPTTPTRTVSLTYQEIEIIRTLLASAMAKRASSCSNNQDYNPIYYSLEKKFEALATSYAYYTYTPSHITNYNNFSIKS